MVNMRVVKTKEVAMNRRIKDKALWAIEKGNKIGNIGVIEAGNAILRALKNKIPTREITKKEAYIVCVRVWYA
jgi:hypothetical protein